MNNKIILVLLLLYILYSKYKIKHENYDIVLAPGGILGFYTLGICHYIKNNYNIENKKMIGFSAGSFNLIFMSLKDKYNIDYLSKLFNLNIRGSDNPKKIISLLQKNMEIEVKFDDLIFDNKYIGLTTNNMTLRTFNKFNTNKELINCCIASSFIPYVTYDDLFYFYKGSNYFDGGIMYHFLKKTLNQECLIISYKMFNRWTNCNFDILNKKDISIYELYNLGYHDAIKNKKYLDSFLL